MEPYELEHYVKEVQYNPEDISTYLKRVTPSLNEHGKEIVIKCALSVAADDGRIDDSEMKLVHDMAETIEMLTTHLKGILHEMADISTAEFSDN